MHGVEMTSADNVVEVDRAGLEQAELLGLAPGSPVLASSASPGTSATARWSTPTCSTGPSGSGSRSKAGDRRRPVSHELRAVPAAARMVQEDHMASDVSLPSDFAGDGQLFVRNATGLVREVSRWDALIMNTLGMNVALGAIFMLLQAPGNFPGGNMLLAIVIGTLVMAFTLLWVYSEFAAAMPRAGGDYVFVSRALHPFVGLADVVEPGPVADLLLDRLQRLVRADVRRAGRDDDARRGHRPLRLDHREQRPAGQAHHSSASPRSGGSSCSARC